MSITFVRELPRRKATFGIKSRQYTRVFEVLSSTANVSAGEVAAGSGMPAVGSPYITTSESDMGALVESVVPVQRDKFGNLWDITVNYNSDLHFEGQGDTPATHDKRPEYRPPVYSLKYRKETISVFKDLGDLLYANTAGQPYKPARTRTVCVPVIGVVKVYLTPAFYTNVGLLDSVNNDTWYGFPAKTVRLENLSEQSSWDNDEQIWTFTYEFAIAPNIFPYMADGDSYGTWNPTRVLSQGSLELDADDNLVPMRDKGTVLQGPFLLDVDGHFTDTAYYQEFTEHTEMSFSALP